MTRITMLGRLTASEDRRLKGTLIPFGVEGLTNLGRVVASKGTLKLAGEPGRLFANLDHLDDRDAVADFVTATETADGWVAEWEARKTHGGDKLLAEYRAGIRTGVSVELEPVAIRAGKITDGTIIGCAFPREPAFPTARLVAELAPDTDDAGIAAENVCTHPDGFTHELAAGASCEFAAPETDPETPEPAPAAPATADAAAADATTQEEDPMTTTATAPAELRASAHTGPQAGTINTPADLFRMMAEMHGSHGANRGRLLAALSDIVPSDIEDANLPQWVGELWSGTAYTRRYTGLVNQATLTGLKLAGWRWTTKPQMSKYAGNKADVSSNTVATEPISDVAQRFAGAHDIDRAMVDFPNPEFWAAYYAAMTESYARLTDAYVLEEYKAFATPITMGAVPAGVPAGWVAVLDGMLAVNETAAPTFALVEKSIYREMFLTGTDKFLEFVNAQIGLDEAQALTSGFRILPVASTAVGDASSTGFDVGEVIVGAKAAGTFHELGGGAPIRVEALDIAKGGVDAGCFGYAGFVGHDNDALVKLDLDADGV
jgi:hypothetical protein